jgi:Ser/Thr protein kinase RdoA (MazF antagonist)
VPPAGEVPAGESGGGDAAAVGRILHEYHLHHLGPSAVRRRSGSVHGELVAFEVTPPGQPPLLIRGYRADAPVPALFSGSAAETMRDFVVGRAATLARLAEAGYPAPRPVRSRSGDLVGVAGTWLTWATSYVAGPVLGPSREQLHLLGTALARLHSIPPGGGAPPGPPPGPAAWHPAAAIAATLGRLSRVEGLVPPDFQFLYEACRRTTAEVSLGVAAVTEGLVHGDAWPGNAVQSAENEVTLIDWETGGIGLPVLDLGHALAECHLDSGLPPDQPDAWLVAPDEARVAALAAGYSGVRTVPPAELDLLPAAVRFGAAFVGAIHLEAVLVGGAAGPAMDARLARLNNRLVISSEVAGLARRHVRTGS